MYVYTLPQWNGHCLQVQLPLYIDGVREKLAENLHELWAMRKIEQGWAYGEVRSHDTTPMLSIY